MLPLLVLGILLLLAPPALAHPGVGIVIDSRGNVFYTDLAHVWRISPEGRKSIAVRDVHTHELYLDGEDNLYGEHLWYEGEASDRWGHRVWRLSPDGTLRDLIPARAGFRDDYDDLHFVRDARGAMYWADRGSPTVIRRRDPDGRVSVLARGDWSVGWMVAGRDGRVYFTDRGNLVRLEPAGSAATLARGLGERRLTQFFVGEHHSLMGLWLDSAGNLYVAVYAGAVVKKVTPRGEVSVAARSGMGWSPTGGLVAPNGDLWLLESRAPAAVRVRRIRPNGEERVF